MSGRTGRAGRFWLLEERAKLPLRKGKQNSHQFQQSWHIICTQKAGQRDSGLLLGPLILFRMRQGESLGVKHLWQWAQNNEEKTQWRGVRSKGGGNRVFLLVRLKSESKGVRSRRRKRRPSCGCDGVN